MTDGDKLPAMLTDKQVVLLSTALERGFFDIPQKVGVGELADELGVSHQAVSEMKRRAVKKLVESAVSGGREATEEYWIGGVPSKCEAWHSTPHCPDLGEDPREVERARIEFHQLNKCQRCPSPFSMGSLRTGGEADD